MQGKALKTTALVTITAAATALLIQACGGGDAIAQSARDPIEGVWESAVSQVDCTTGATVSTFRSSQVFHQGGTLGDTSLHPTSTRGPGWGIWSRGNDGYTVKFRFYRYGADGSHAGSSVSTMTVTMGSDGNTFTARRTTRVLDPAGNQVGQVCTNDSGVRFN